MTSKFISILIFTALLFNLSCNNSIEKDLQIVSVSILPQKYFIEALSGDHFTINVLIPTGANPASYEPSPRQMTAL
ncbi:MAG: zinc ABC transporter solute-binding protein, partial [Bacteroidetes bacterium]|nr:zinc ABC transporter solute-binding protein [Bacteroidota bacterium]